MLFSVTYVLTSCAEKTIEAENYDKLKAHMEQKDGVGEEFYGPLSQGITALFKKQMDDGVFYVHAFVKKVPTVPDEVAE